MVDKISHEFDPSKIDHRIAENNGTVIKLLGVLLIEQDLKFLSEVGNKIVGYIKECILRDDAKETFKISEIVNKTGVEEIEARISFELISQCGGGFWNSARREEEWYGHDDFTIKRNEPHILNRYLAFTDVESTIKESLIQIREWLEKEKEGNRRPKSTTPSLFTKKRLKKIPFQEVDLIILEDLFENTRGYLEQIAFEASECYRHRLYDGSLILIRKLLEILIIELYEKNGTESLIKDSGGNFLQFSKLIDFVKKDPKLGLSRSTKSNLPRIKKIADNCAHNRRFIAKKVDFDNVIEDIRMVIQELVNHVDYTKS